jgi:thiamine pyrophosphate-dependent acetolactate synthase large subunit-like protein
MGEVTVGDSEAAAPSLDRRNAVAAIVRDRRDALVITGLGSTTYDVAAAADVPENFYLWGAMGGASLVGLGLALAQPARRVIVITGDGEMMMGIGGLATIGVTAPANLSVIVIDNEHYGETGMQIGHTGRGVDLEGIARACRFRSATTIRTSAQLEAWIPHLHSASGPLFACIKVASTPVPSVLPARDGTYLMHRFRTAILGSAPPAG